MGQIFRFSQLWSETTHNWEAMDKLTFSPAPCKQTVKLGRGANTGHLHGGLCYHVDSDHKFLNGSKIDQQCISSLVFHRA